MSTVDRYRDASTIRRFIIPILLGAAVGVAGCSDGSTSPSPPPGNVFLLRAAAGASLPAIVDHYEGDGQVIDLYVVADTLTLDDAGKYLQKGLLEARMGSTVVSRVRWSDHGRYTVEGTALHAISEYIESVTFDGTMGSDGSLVVTQDLAGNGVPQSYSFLTSRR